MERDLFIVYTKLRFSLINVAQNRSQYGITIKLNLSVLKFIFVEIVSNVNEIRVIDYYNCSLVIIPIRLSYADRYTEKKMSSTLIHQHFSLKIAAPIMYAKFIVC